MKRIIKDCGNVKGEGLEGHYQPHRFSSDLLLTDLPSVPIGLSLKMAWQSDHKSVAAHNCICNSQEDREWLTPESKLELLGKPISRSPVALRICP